MLVLTWIYPLGVEIPRVVNADLLICCRKHDLTVCVTVLVRVFPLHVQIL